jgi:hypothetical protein
MKNASVASKGVAAKKCAIRALAERSLARKWEIELRERYTPLVVKERVRNGMKRKEIKAFLLDRNMSGYPGGLNGSTQHSARTHLALKTKAKIAR